jgi:hypothetical protein
VALEIRRRAQQAAAAAGRERVERADLSTALSQYYAEKHPEDDDPSEAPESPRGAA